MTQQPQPQPQQPQNQVPQTITIDDTTYKVSSLGEKGAALINNHRRVEAKLNEIQFEAYLTQLALTKIGDELKQELPNFEKVEESEVQETVETKVEEK